MAEASDFLMRQDPARIAELLRKMGSTLGMFHGELADVLGVSRRTVSRWGQDGARLRLDQVAKVAELAYAHDPSLAAEIAAAAGETLVTLGLEAAAPPEPRAAPEPPMHPEPPMPPELPPIVAAPPPPPVVPAPPRVAPQNLVDAVVCAAAEALDVSPRVVRPGLLAAIRCAREVGLTVEEMEAALSAARPGGIRE
jgi:transcriptional regulator with XRE-family HTH domain